MAILEPPYKKTVFINVKVYFYLRMTVSRDSLQIFESLFVWFVPLEPWGRTLTIPFLKENKGQLMSNYCMVSIIIIIMVSIIIQSLFNSL